MLATVLACGSATAQVRVKGSVFGGGNNADVQTNTVVNISAGQVEGNVYGGGNVGDVGTINKTNIRAYKWTDEANPGDTYTYNNTGSCTVSITGGTIGPDGETTPDDKGNVFGAGKGVAESFWCEKAMVYKTTVTISGGTVKNTVFGGGEVGRVENNTVVTIGVEGATDGAAAPTIAGDVFGAGMGLATHGYSALVRGNTNVTIQGTARVGRSVYGGGEIATVGKYNLVQETDVDTDEHRAAFLADHPGVDPLIEAGMPYSITSDNLGICTVSVKDNAVIGQSGSGDVFGAGKGVEPAYTADDAATTDTDERSKRMMSYNSTLYTTANQTTWAYSDDSHEYVWEYFDTEAKYLTFVQTLALATQTYVTVGGSAQVNGSVYGGSESGYVQHHTQVTVQETCNVGNSSLRGNVFGGGRGISGNTTAGRASGNTTVNILGGTTYGDVYGGGEKGPVGTSSTTTTDSETSTTTTTYPTATVNLLGGTITGDAYGGGLGDPSTAADAGNTQVNLNGMAISEYTEAFADYLVAFDTSTPSNGNDYYMVNPEKVGCKVNRIFGANNTNGTPKGNVTVHVYATQSKIAENNTIAKKSEIDTNTYDLSAVYGGGNEAAYDPATPYENGTGSKSQVIIEGCAYTSIETVYGGGNAAAVPETNVKIVSDYEIGTVFGGGNGKDNKSDGSANPGADIGTKDQGANRYGTGNANTLITGGYVHEAYGGSNEKGTIMGSVNLDASADGICEMLVKKMVGAGKNADIMGNAIVTLGCMPEKWVDEYYGGADNANVHGNVELTITSGNFRKVFGANNAGGIIMGHVKVNIEETGCRPINIDELYLGGNQAAYSRYGYYVVKDENDAPILNDGKLTFMPRESADDTHLAVKRFFAGSTYQEYSGSENDVFTPYAQPELNIISCTRIGKVFGGGLGETAKMYADPTVNINQIYGTPGGAVSTALGAIGGDYTDAHDVAQTGGVFGGGNAANVYGNTTVNIGNLTEVSPVTTPTGLTKNANNKYDVVGANIVGNVYGGGNLANVGDYHLGTDNEGKTIDVIDKVGHTFVNICAVKGAEILDEQSQSGTGRYNYSSVSFAADKVTIGGDVFGGGKGEAADPGAGTLTGAFRCGKAMVTGATNVAIGNGTVSGTVYGGGEVGRVEQNTSVTIGMGDGAATGGTSTPVIMHDVYGAGKGVMTHGYAALVRGHAYVTVEGNAQIKHSVYGGGEIASVGRYNIADAAYHAQHPEVEVGMPYSLKDQGSGYCYVNVGGYAEIGEDDMSMTKAGGPDDFGYIFGAGRGILPYEGYNSSETPWRVHPSDIKEEYTSEKENDYLLFIESLALATHTYVTVGGHAFVKGSVYGGSENGHVQHDTDVRIQDHCQIGNGWDATKNEGAGGGVNARYDEDLFINPATATPDQINTSAATLKECSSWVFGKDTNNDDKADTFEPYDKHGAGGGAIMASDGHTFYGNVFGGGSGLYAFDREGRISGKSDHEWLRSAGRVYGNTNVTITGGHILTSVYGGCELTDVGNGRSIEEGKGKCTVKMSGGTLGVPRTLAQIAAHPVTCYLFGAGKGDQRAHFNQWTNVDNVEVEVSGNAIIYGSVFGGGEDGHVLGDTKVTIKENAVIGTWGTSYVDGNIFGAGRGFGGDALTAGVVCGNVDIDIQGGTLLGSVYGGGRLGSVGTYLVPSTHANYGKLIPDGKTITINEDEGTATETDQEGITHGEISISISGGTIGNNIEYAYIAPTVTGDALTTAKTYMPNTDHDGQNRLTHTKGGNVFAGAMGRLNGLAEGTYLEHWPDLGKAKKTTLNISGGTIKSNVYGGGELGTLEQGSTISITGGTIGTEIAESMTTGEGEGATTSDVVHYTFGSVFGGGAGSNEHRNGTLTDNTTVNTDDHAGLVKGSTKITMSAGAVKGSVYGGGELAIVQGSHTTESKTVGAEINISGGTIGYNQDGFGGATMGNVYGAGKGSLETKQAGLIKSNTLINISGGNIYHNIYGGGAYGSVGTFTYETPSGNTQPASTPSGCTEGTGTAWINITGGTIGINGHENGMVFGSSRGDVAAPDASDEDPNNKLAWVDNTYVTIGTSAGSNSAPWIMGSVYGSGENGHVLTNTDVTIHDGKIGIEEDDGARYDITSGNTTYKGAAYPSRGNVYGGGCGTDTYDVTTGTGDDAVTKYYFNRSAGIVRGNSTITMDGGQVVRTIYGGGAMGSIGKFTRESKVESDPYNSDSHVPGIVSSCAENTGLATVSISGGTVGPKNDTTIPDGAGNVFGASRGEIHDATEYPNLERMVFVDNTAVTISETATVKGSVYGGSEAGHVLTATNVSMTGGSVDQNIYGGGNLGDVGLYTTDAGGANIYAAGKGVCTVSISGGAVTGNVFGAGKGEGTTFTCEKAMVNSTTVTVENGTVNGNVYGGGEVGRVESNTVVTIGKADDDSSAPDIKGSVFGAGAGLETHGYSALVRGNTTVTVQGSAKVGENVYGGGKTASVGRYGLDAEKMPSILLGGGECAVSIGGNAVIGQGGTGNVFGACKGVDPHFDKDNADKTLRSRRMTMYNATEFLDADKGTKWEYYAEGSPYVWEYYQDEASYTKYLETLALATRPTVTIKGSAGVNGSVYGGGERGITKGTVAVNIEGGNIAEDVYGGGALANTNTTKLVGVFDGNGIPKKNGAGQYETTEVHPTTKVSLTGGTIARNVYGGGLGRLAKTAVAAQEAQGTEGEEGYVPAVEAQEAVEAVEAKVYGNVLVELNKTTDTDNCVVKGNIFGCNNLNGSPQAGVTVHVYKTADYAGHEKDASKSNSKFNVNAVYGGGNLAAFYPDDANTRATAKANVIIEGCDLTSIGTVYGGGNAASVPETDVVINSAYEIGQAFGGGNGADDVSYDGGVTYVTNPGANVGYLPYSSDSEKTAKAYGAGNAHVSIFGGTVHAVYGGSNTKGNVRWESRATLRDDGFCEFNVAEAYGGGRNALQDGNAVLDVDCISGLGKAYGGASNADVNGNVMLNITNGTYGQVFGGNDAGGCIRGSITVNIEETGCRPVIIGELYGGGNQAAYSVYGYNDDGTVKTSGDAVKSPVVNVRSFTSIGKIFGGGFGNSATMVGDPTVNINVVKGKYENDERTVIDEGARVVGSHVVTDATAAGYADGYPIPSHAKNTIGAIQDVFGGGNAAEVIGNPKVNVGTEAGDEVYVAVTPATGTDVTSYFVRSGEEGAYTYSAATGTADGNATYYQKQTVSVDIRGNVYGGGNNAVVTGNTEVVIGKKKIND